ncbi:histidine kinase dimerization/phospho-acceptor domain-containing protein, partial [Enterobacter chengduensis]|uniref:histidine kinase dimerization/phospho-acceptor domain-containing protein n=1 Tax=Enterobacter chengduensis TaxID=2494701 RepID=UPI0020033F80
MNKESVLSRQILTYMLLLTFTIIAIAVLGSWLFYSFILDHLPGGTISSDDEQMTMWDWVWIGTATTISLFIALFFTVKLSSRILTPLNAVASSLKKISQGELNARAFCASSRLGEINHLVTDFNEMAEKLQTLDMHRKTWNAAIAHELRTPVTILRGRLQGLVDGVFTPDPVLFHNLLKQTEGLTRLIEDLRVISSDGGAGYTLHPSRRDLKGTIQDALDTFMPEFNRKAFTVSADLRKVRI